MMRMKKWLFLVLLTVCLAGFATEQSTEKASVETHNFKHCNDPLDCMAAIRVAIRKNWIRPISVITHPQIVLLVELDDKANVVKVLIKKSSGDRDLDSSTLSAVMRASPFLELLGLNAADYKANFSHFKLQFFPEDITN